MVNVKGRYKAHGSEQQEFCIFKKQKKQKGEPELIPFSGMLPKGLSASEQRILTLRLAEDMDYSTISEKLGISETACRSQYSRARRHCAELMERSDDNAGF